jgi:hypothetical protein
MRSARLCATRRVAAATTASGGGWRPVTIAAYAYGNQTMVGWLLWLFLLLFCWPLAIAALLLYPLVWLLLLPFRLLGITIEAVFALLRSIVMLPARLLGGAR